MMKRKTQKMRPLVSFHDDRKMTFVRWRPGQPAGAVDRLYIFPPDSRHAVWIEPAPPGWARNWFVGATDRPQHDQMDYIYRASAMSWMRVEIERLRG